MSQDQAPFDSGKRSRGRPKGLGKAPGSGRKKGSKNRYTAIREHLLGCFRQLDLAQAVNNVMEAYPVEGLKILVSLLPKQVEADMDVSGRLLADQIVEAMDAADERVRKSQ